MLKVKIEYVKLLREVSSPSILKDIDFSLKNGEVYSILGENGAGKSTLIKLLTQLLDERFFKIKAQVQFKENDILSIEKEELRKIRHFEIRYVFQDAVNSFDPLKTFEYYFEITKADKKSIEELLEYFLLPAYNKLCKLHPYELSGGMAQRVSIVLALLVKPSLLILDEPTSATDIPVANLIKLKLGEFIRSNSSSVLIITQDLKFASEVSDKIAYLNDGKLSEFYEVTELFPNKTEIDFQIFKDKIIGLPG